MLPLPPSVGQISLAATHTYTSKRLIVFNGPFGVLPSADRVNLNVAWTSIAGGRVHASFVATDVTNEHCYAFVNDQRRSGFVSRVLSQPRMYGLRLRHRIGG